MVVELIDIAIAIAIIIICVFAGIMIIRLTSR